MEFLLWIGGHVHGNGLPGLQQGEVLLRQEEVHQQGGQVLQGGDRGARRDVVADVHLADADGAAEGRVEAFLRQRCLELGDDGGGALVLGGETVELALGDGATGDQVAATLVLHLGQAEIGLGGAQGGFLDGAFQLDDGLAFLDLVAGGEQHLAHRAGGFGGERHALVGAQGADGRQAVLPAALLGRHGRDADRRHGRRVLGDLLANGEVFKAGEHRYNNGNHRQHDQHAA
ncbi:hypothetical protein D3C78_941140 [compost metagenome]